MVDKLRRAYTAHKHNAAKRGIKMLLTFSQWLDIWTRSGHLQERGCKRGQYVMARKGDRGHYRVGNVEIILVEQNRAFRRPSSIATLRKKIREALLNQRQSITTRRKRAASIKAVWARRSDTDKEAIRVKISNTSKLRRPTQRTRVKLSLAQKRRWERIRAGLEPMPKH